jgi:2'-5' RNA ligase
VAGDGHLRLFCALRLPGGTAARIADWQAGELHGGRLVPREGLHVTLAFLGRRPAGELPEIAAALRAVAAGSRPVRLLVRGYRETRTVGMLTFDDEGGAATELAGRLQERLEALGLYRREARPWLPHLTVLRFRERPRLRPPLPDLGEVTPSDAAVFMSGLRPGGAVYEALETAALGG